MKIDKFEELECWREARKATNLIYIFTRTRPFFTDFRLRDQITGASISIMNNIAEGFDSQSNAEFIRFLKYARRSASEAKNCLYIAKDQKYITKEEFDSAFNQIQITRKLIDGFLRYLRKNR